MKNSFPVFCGLLLWLLMSCSSNRPLPVSDVELKLEVFSPDTFRFSPREDMIFQVKMTNLSQQTVQVSDPRLFGNVFFKMWVLDESRQNSVYPLSPKYQFRLDPSVYDERIKLASGASILGDFSMALNKYFNKIPIENYLLEIKFVGNAIEGDGKKRKTLKSKLVASKTVRVVP